MIPLPRIALDRLQGNGFSLGDGDPVQNVALLSLRSGLRSYFSTYATMRHALHVMDPKHDERSEEVVRRHGLDYAEACFSTIVHFQHFAELVCKQVLYSTHPLLAVTKLDKKHDLVFRLLRGEPILDEEAEKLQWSEFSESLDRLASLVRSGRLDQGKYGFIAEACQALAALNTLRNRLLHRGRFFLFCASLDELVGGHLLPFVLRAVGLDGYVGHEHLWMHRPLKCGVDPIKELCSSFTDKGFDLTRVAFFKEMGRAAYSNPIDERYRYLGQEENDKIRILAQTSAGATQDGVYQIRDCPVCGVSSLVVSEDSDTEVDDNEEPICNWWKTFSVKCECCGFSVDDELENPSKYGVQIPDFWESKRW